MRGLKGFLGTVLVVSLSVVMTLTVVFTIQRGKTTVPSIIMPAAKDQGSSLEKTTGPAGSLIFSDVKDGLQFSVELNKQKFVTSDQIVVKARITNTSDKTIIYDSGSSSLGDVNRMWIAVKVPGHDSYFIHKPDPKELLPQTADIVYRELKPNQTLEKEMTLLPYMQISQEKTAVPSGNYELEVGLIREDYKRISIFVPLEVSSSSSKILTGEQAQEKAESNGEVKKWIAGHSGEAAAKFEKGEYYVRYGGEWERASKEYYEQILKNSYEKFSSLEGKLWKITYIGKYGEAPHRLEVSVDSVTGEVKKVEKFDR